MKTINIKLTLVITVLLSAMLISCDKDNDNQDNESPVITILQPTIGQTYTSGDTVHIQAAISDNDQLHDISAVISRTFNEDTEDVWTLETHSHDETFDLFGWYVIEVPGMHNDFVLSVTASDHNGNEETQSFEFHVME